MDTTVQPVPRSPGKRRYRTLDEKRRIVEETLGSETSVAIMARRHGVNANLVFNWRKAAGRRVDQPHRLSLPWQRR